MLHLTFCFLYEVCTKLVCGFSSLYGQFPDEDFQDRSYIVLPRRAQFNSEIDEKGDMQPRLTTINIGNPRFARLATDKRARQHSTCYKVGRSNLVCCPSFLV